MTLKRKRTGRAVSMPWGILLGIGLSMGITILGAAILAYFINGQTLDENAVGFGSMIILALASLIGTLTAVWTVKRRRVQVAAITGAGYLLVLMSMNALVFGGQYAGIGTTVLVVGIASALAVFSGIGGEKRSNIHLKKRLHG